METGALDPQILSSTVQKGEPSPANDSATRLSPTVLEGETQAGVLLGTVTTGRVKTCA
jgi:hypothetical protein